MWLVWQRGGLGGNPSSGNKICGAKLVRFQPELRLRIDSGWWGLDSRPVLGCALVIRQAGRREDGLRRAQSLQEWPDLCSRGRWFAKSLTEG